MSHLLAAASESYAWPNFNFTSDGQSIQLNLQPSEGATDPLRYLERLDAWVLAKHFASGIDAFISRTLEQLYDYAEQTLLYQLWQTVQEKRATPKLALQRPLEAPESLMALLFKLASAHGEASIHELACIGHEYASKAIE